MLKQTALRSTRTTTATAFRPRTLNPILFNRSFSFTSTAMKAQKGTIHSIEDVSTSDTKWVALRKINWTDQSNVTRTWEVASRKTRGKAGVDAVAMGNIILHPSKAPTTILVLQYRPPIDAISVEWPAGLVDADESVEDAAVRELREETGYEGKVTSVSPIVAADPGMTSANMQLAMMEVHLKEGDKEPEQQLDEGEHIERVVVPIAELYERLVEYSNMEGYMVSAKLFHWAHGVHMAKTKSYL
ncbi:ADP-ribose pyrophosphatase [Aureobasidium sp. EXF-12298]